MVGTPQKNVSVGKMTSEIIRTFWIKLETLGFLLLKSLGSHVAFVSKLLGRDEDLKRKELVRNLLISEVWKPFFC